MLATYAAQYGFSLSPIAASVCALLMDEVSVSTDNLLSNPNTASQWTAYNSGVLSQYDSRTIELINGGSIGAYTSRQITTIAGQAYKFRAYCVDYNSFSSCRLIAGTTIAGVNLGTTSQKSTGYFELIFIAIGTTTYLGFQNNNSYAGSVSYWSNIECVQVESNGVDETTQLQTNGTFTTDTSGWTKYQNSGTGVISSVAGQLLIDNNGSATGTKAVQGITTVIGQAYKASVDLIGVTGATAAYLRSTDDSTGLPFGSSICEASSSTATTLTINFVADAATTYIALIVSSTDTSATVTFDNVVVTKSGNLLSNGILNVDAGWTKGTGWTISGGVATATAGSASVLNETITATGLKYYLITYTLTRTAGGIAPRLNGSTTNTGTWRYSSGTFADLIQAPIGVTSFDFYKDSSFAGTIDNVTMREAAYDQTGNGYGAALYGELQRSIVAANSTTVAESGFTAYNYRQIPYNSAFDPGTGSFSISFWLKAFKNSAQEYIFYRGQDDALSAYYQAYVNSTGHIVFSIYDGTRLYSLSSNASINDGTFRHCVLTVDTINKIMAIYINGPLDNSTTFTTLTTLSNVGATMRIGMSYGSSALPLTHGSLAGFQVDIGNLWPAQTVSTQYDLESVLFEQFELFSIVGNTYNYQCDLQSATPKPNVVKSSSKTLSGKIKNVVWNQKREYNCHVTPFPRSELSAAYHFLRNTEVGTFTFDERGSLYAPDNPITVNRISSNEPEQYQRGNYYTYTFDVLGS